MKEYKLSRKSKYSLFYLLSGLFMFFFMFAILNLSSYASQDGTSAFPYYVIDRYNLDNYTAMFPGGSNYSSLVNNTDVGKYYHLVGRVNVVPDSITNTDEEFSIVLNTSDGSYNIYTSSATSTMGSYNFSFDIYFKGKYSSLVRYEKEHVGGVGEQFAFYTYTVLVDSCMEVSSSSGSSLFNFSDYSSYSPVSILNSFDTNTSYGNTTFNVGQIYDFNFPNYSGSSAAFATAWAFFNNTVNSHYVYSIYFSSSSYFTSIPNTALYIRDANGADVATYSFNIVNVGSADPNIRRYYAYVSFDLPNEGIYQCYCGGSFPTIVFNTSFSLNVYKATIADYMQYVKDNYDSINPSVIDLNQNTAQSVSDISTAQTFETSAFDNFDAQFSSSGLDTFSLSFASTPLLWVSSIITTFYNNMPSTFQYLLMFVSFVGILCTVLNVFGRVAQRFGGGDSSRLNSKDVFSKIEKNGSI